MSWRTIEYSDYFSLEYNADEGYYIFEYENIDAQEAKNIKFLSAVYEKAKTMYNGYVDKKNEEIKGTNVIHNTKL
jgi:hypothetical protein